MILHCPVKLVNLLLDTILNILIRVETKFQIDLASQAIGTLNSYFNQLTTNDIDFNILENYFNCLKNYNTIVKNFLVRESNQEPGKTLYVNNSNIANILDINELSMAITLKYLQSGVFKRKFAGIKMLVATLQPIKNEIERESRRKFLINQKVLDIVYIKGYHREIALRSNDLLTFLAPNLNAQILIGLLKNGFGQSEEKAGVICEAIKSIICDL